MEKLIFTGLLFFAVLHSHAQITMDASGNIALGSSFLTSGYDVATGSMYTGSEVKFGGYQGHLIFDFYGYGVRRMRPNANNVSSIGASNYAFNYVYTYNLQTLSDYRQKENVRAMQGSLNKIRLLKGVIYDYKKENYIPEFANENSALYTKYNTERKNKIGFIAQDVKEILPEVVCYDDSTDIYSIDYTKIVPVLVEAIKEQQLIIESLQSEIQGLKNNSASDSKLKSTTVSNNSTDIHNSTLSQTNALYQNAPNPFLQSTSIEYFIVENVQKAMICIYDMNGSQLNCIPLHLTGYGNITINGSELKSGMYMYSLIADGQLIDTKRMILTD